MIRLKIEYDHNVVKYISLLRKYDNSISLNDIKKRIEKHDFVIEHNYNSAYDISDDLNNIDRNIMFRELIANLIEQGAKLEIFLNDMPITIDILDNWLKTLKEIEQDTIADIDRESE